MSYHQERNGRALHMSQPDQARLPDADERRRRYFDEYNDRIDRHREGLAFYERNAIEFATSILKVLTYLNGGGLLAIPAVVALFRTDPREVKAQLICAAAAFVAGLVLVVMAQACAFFVMARRSEAEIELQYEQMELLAAIHYPNSPEEQASRTTRAAQNRGSYVAKQRQSNIWRLISLVCVWASLLLFIVGSFLGGAAVFQAK